MFNQLKALATRSSRRLTFALMIGAAILVAGIAAFSQPATASAHCDSVNGPVVKAASKALDTGEIKWVLAYVQSDAEPELTAAFQQTLNVRKASPEAKDLADHYFFETAVRLHRAGEGAAYTGLKEQTDFGPALASAEKALETNSLDDVQQLLNKTVSEGLNAQYKMVIEARDQAAREGTVEALREQAEAELIFEKYVDALHKAAAGNAVAAEGAGTAVAPAPAAGHTH